MIKFLTYIIVLVKASCIALFLDSAAAGCFLNLGDKNPEPVVVTTNGQFLYPESDGEYIDLQTEDTIIISCTGSTFWYYGSFNLGATISATCKSNTNFAVNASIWEELQTIDLYYLACMNNPQNTARYTGNSCELGGKEIEVGFELSSSLFAQEMLICFDQTSLTPYYSTYVLTKSIGHYENGVARPSFVEDDLYNLSSPVNDLYERTRQRSTINSLLGLLANSTKYIQEDTDYYLERGHLTAAADFVWASQQMATFHYCNAAPQWQTFNGGNWDTLEQEVRTYAEQNTIDLTVYTGTYGVTTLPHEDTGKDVPLYLYSENGEEAIPVPELFWKVIYDPSTKLGTAFLGVNNPYQENVNKSIICADVSSKISWLTWKSTDVKSGYSYACNVDDLRTKISYLPDFEVQGLLL